MLLKILISYFSVVKHYLIVLDSIKKISPTIKYLSWDNLFYSFYVLHNSFHVSILLLSLKAPNLNSYEFNCHHNNLNLSEQISLM